MKTNKLNENIVNKQAQIEAELAYEKQMQEKLASIPIDQKEFAKIESAFRLRQAQIEAELAYQKQTQEKLASIPIDQRELAKIENAFCVQQTQSESQTDTVSQQKSTGFWLRLANSAVVMVLVVALVVSGVYWLGGFDDSAFGPNTPYQFVTFEEIPSLVSQVPLLPLDFDNGFSLSWVKIHYPKVNQPCAISMSFANDNQIIDLMIMIDSRYEYFERSKFEICISQFNENGISGVYTIIDGNILRAVFEGNKYIYYFEGSSIDFEVFESFMQSLR